MDLPRLVLLMNLASTLFMAGVIWFVQVVHYPLFADIGDVEIPAYEQRHGELTTRVVGPPMIVELATSLLLFWFRPAGATTWLISVGLALVAVIWLSTAFLQVPCHELLSRNFDAAVQHRLVATNWIRTVAWSLRGLLVLWMVWSSMMPGGIVEP